MADHVKSEMAARLLNIPGPDTLEIGTNKAVVRDNGYLCAWWTWQTRIHGSCSSYSDHQKNFPKFDKSTIDRQ